MNSALDTTRGACLRNDADTQDATVKRLQEFDAARTELQVLQRLQDVLRKASCAMSDRQIKALRRLHL